MTDMDYNEAFARWLRGERVPPTVGVEDGTPDELVAKYGRCATVRGAPHGQDDRRRGNDDNGTHLHGHC